MDPKSLIKQANELVNELYDFRNRYFIGKELEKLTKSREEAVNERIPVSKQNSFCFD